MAIEQFLYTHPVFRYEEFARLKQSQGITSIGTIKQALRYYIESQKIKSIKRGLYAAIPPNATPENLIVDPYLIAGKATEDSVLAYHTALELYGVAYTSFQQFTFLTKNKIKPFDYQNQYFHPASLPTIIKANKLQDISIENIDRQGLQIRITSLARTYVDALARVELSGGWEEVLRSLNNISALNIEEVIEYCLKLENPTVAAKTGMMLEQRQGVFAVDENYLKELLAKRPKWPTYITTSRREPNRYVKKWNLMVPEYILNQSWEEPNYDV
jgi:predicted transcriptional regulator of viral defense system